MTAATPIPPEDLHAYVDGALDSGRRAEVEDWLARNPKDADRVASWRAQNNQLHALFDPVLEEPLPAGMTGVTVVPRAPVRRWPWKQAAAAALFLAIGFAAGWAVHDAAILAPAGNAFVQQAVGAHVVFTRENRHAVEVRADREEAHLVRWLSRRLGHEVKPPPLREMGFTLVGGRLVADPGGPAAQFLYEDKNKRRVTLYVRRGGKGTKTAFRYVHRGDVAAFYWIDASLSYALIAKMERTELLRLARVVYGALGS